MIPTEHIYEPNWGTGKAVRWRIALPDGSPMGIASIYNTRTNPQGQRLHTFATLIVNADGHPVMPRFLRPEGEKRMVVILRQDEYGERIACSVADAPGFFRRWEGPLDAVPDPLPPRIPKAISGKVVKPPKPAPPETASLF